MRNQFITDVYYKQAKSLYDKGTREFKKLISCPSLCDRLVSQRVPLFIHNQNFFNMRNQKREKNGSDFPVNEIKNLHADNRQSLINNLYNRSINRLIDDFIIEMDAKNQAYYFILSKGYFNDFRTYCLNSNKES